MGTLSALVKFGDQPHILQLRETGLIYMNNLRYFWGIEDAELRGDPCDSVESIVRGVKGTISIDDEELPDQITKWTVRVHPPNPETINIFCMYTLRPSRQVDDRNIRFGNYALVVNDVPEFIQRMKARLADEHIQSSAKMVEYVDDNHVGEVGPFRKLNAFAYQSEWRVVCYNGPGGVRTISIGSIEDISIIMESKRLTDAICS